MNIGKTTFSMLLQKGAYYEKLERFIEDASLLVIKMYKCIYILFDNRVVVA